MTTKKKATVKRARSKAAKRAPVKPKTRQKGRSKMSALEAATKLLSESKHPMSCKKMIDAMAAKGLWTSPGGKTPHATLYSAILREIGIKGKEARFKKTDRGHFAANG
jgi:hypothetical protein